MLVAPAGRLQKAHRRQPAGLEILEEIRTVAHMAALYIGKPARKVLERVVVRQIEGGRVDDDRAVAGAEGRLRGPRLDRVPALVIPGPGERSGVEPVTDVRIGLLRGRRAQV